MLPRLFNLGLASRGGLGCTPMMRSSKRSTTLPDRCVLPGMALPAPPLPPLVSPTSLPMSELARLPLRGCLVLSADGITPPGADAPDAGLWEPLR